jgi:integrase
MEAVMKYLSEKEEKHLVRTVREVKGRKAERDHVIIRLGLGLALRADELAGLTVGDVRNRETLFVRPEIAKLGSSGMVPIAKDLQALIRHFIKLKLTWKELIHDTSPLFVSRLDAPLSKRSLQEAVEGWMIRAGLTTTRDGNVVALYSVHSLRHTCAMRMRERHVRLETVQKFLRHKSLASTGIYTEATLEELAEAAEMRR